MRNLFVALLVSGLVLAGCSKKGSDNPLAPAPAPAPTSNVVFTMHMESGTEGMIFVASPSIDVKLQKVIVKYPPVQFADTLTNPDPASVFAKGSNVKLGEYTGVEMKQVWELTFIGTEAATNKPFSVMIKWEVI